MSATSTKTNPDPYRSAFGKRLQEQVARAARRIKISQKDLEIQVTANLNFDENHTRFMKWYRGDTAPKIIDLCKFLTEIENITNSQVDLPYVMLGREHIDTPANELTKTFNTKTDRILDEIRLVSDYLRDHEPGVEGVLMRQSVLFLEDLQNSGLTQPNYLLSGEDEKADNAKNKEPFVAGYLPDKLVEIVESTSIHTRLASLTLESEIETSDQEGKKPGRFFYAVAKNLRAGKKYTFILPESDKNWAPAIENFVAELEDRGNVDLSHMQNISFFQTGFPLGAGFILMDIELEKLRNKRKFLAREIEKDYLENAQNTNKKSRKTKDGKIEDIRDIRKLGMLFSASKKTHGAVLMDVDRTKDAQIAWDKYLDNAKLLWGHLNQK